MEIVMSYEVKVRDANHLNTAAILPDKNHAQELAERITDDTTGTHAWVEERSR